MTPRTLALVAVLVLTTSLTAQQRAPMIESITQADLRADLFFLAGDAMRGRLTDTNENRVTADYIRSRFERAGLKPVANGGYFHNYNLMSATLGEGNRFGLVLGPEAGREFKAGQDFYPQRFSGTGQVSALVAFAGFGITSPKINHDDYKGDVKGKVVLVLDHEPGERDPNSPFEGVVTAEAAAQWRKALAAQQKGAAGSSSAISTITRIRRTSNNRRETSGRQRPSTWLRAAPSSVEGRRRASLTTRWRHGRIASGSPRHKSRRR